MSMSNANLSRRVPSRASSDNEVCMHATSSRGPTIRLLVYRVQRTFSMLFTCWRPMFWKRQ